MKVYSRSQGKVIDQPTDQTGGMGGMVPGGGINQDMFQLMAIQDMKETGGKNMSKIAAFKAMFPEEKKSASTEKRELALNQAAPVLQRIISSAMEAPTGGEGWWKAQTGRIPGVSGGEAEYLRRDTEAFARLIAATFASEVGVATDKDISRWKSMMPQPGDTYEERVRMSEKLISQIQNEAKSLGMEAPPSIVEAVKLLPSGKKTGEVPLTQTKQKSIAQVPGQPQQTDEQARIDVPFLKDNLLLQPAGYMAGKATLNNPLGAFLGTAGATRLKQVGEQGIPVSYKQQLKETFDPELQKENIGEMVKKGGISALLDMLLNPKKTISGLTGFLGGRSGATIPRDTIGMGLQQAKESAPIGSREQFLKQTGEVLQDVPESGYSIPQALETRRSLSKSYSQLNPAQESARRLISEQIKQEVPAIKPLDLLYNLISKGQRFAKKFVPFFGKQAIYRGL